MKKATEEKIRQTGPISGEESKAKVREATNERAKELGSSYEEGEVGEYPVDIQGLKPLAEQLNATQKKILDIILTDFSHEPEVESENSIYKRLREACKRAGMRDGGAMEKQFFNTVADPGFMDIVSKTGQGLVGIHVIPLVSKLIQMGLEGDKQCLFKALEIANVTMSKYEFHMNKYNLRHGNDLNIGELNLNKNQGDDYLGKLIAEIEYGQEA